MTFPAGPLPDYDQIVGSFRPFASCAFTHGGTDLDLTLVSNGVAPCATEFICTATGNLAVVMAGDVGAAPYSSPTVRTYAMNAGDVLYGCFVLAKSTSTADGLFRK